MLFHPAHGKVNQSGLSHEPRLGHADPPAPLVAAGGEGSTKSREVVAIEIDVSEGDPLLRAIDQHWRAEGHNLLGRVSSPIFGKVQRSIVAMIHAQQQYPAAQRIDLGER